MWKESTVWFSGLCVGSEFGRKLDFSGGQPKIIRGTSDPLVSKKKDHNGHALKQAYNSEFSEFRKGGGIPQLQIT